MAGRKIKTVEIITWLTSILIGPAVVHYILHHPGETVFCNTPEHCKTKMLLFFIIGFLFTWALYWSIKLIARYIKPPSEKTDTLKSSEADSDNDSLTFE